MVTNIYLFMTYYSVNLNTMTTHASDVMAFNGFRSLGIIDKYSGHFFPPDNKDQSSSD